jgi:hypothetical protein
MLVWKLVAQRGREGRARCGTAGGRGEDGGEKLGDGGLGGVDGEAVTFA